MNVPKFGIGASALRKEDLALLKGEGRFTDDLRVEDALHGYVLRSPYAHARFTLGSTEAAASLPGVHLVLTADDIAGLGDVPNKQQVRQPDGSIHARREAPVLCRGVVRHIGDGVAFIVADNREIAEDAAELIDWHGEDWTPDSGELSSHPNSRFCTPITQCPVLAPESENAPQGVPISAIIFGGRRKTTIPLVVESRDWQHGVFMGATTSSETTAAATGAVGVVRRDPMAMLPFIGYNVGDYLNHWINIGKQADAAKLPKVYYVNWFRRDDDGSFLWPGFGDNSRVLKWIIERLEGKADAVDTAIGRVPAPGSLDVGGLDITDEQFAKATAVNIDEWKAEIPLIEEWFATIGDRLPASMQDEFGTLRSNLENA